MGIQERLCEKLCQADRTAANAILDDWVAEHGYELLLEDVIEPTLQHMGDQWRSCGSFSLAQAYVAAKVAEDVMLKIAAHVSAGSASHPAKGPVVIGNIEEDFHALGRRMVATFLRAHGWIVHDLGNDVLPAAFVDKAVEVGARVIGASAMMMTTARNIIRLREEIDRRGLKGRLQLAVGGAVFTVSPELVAEVGGDGTATNAVGAAGLFDALWEKSLQLEPVA